MADTSGNIFLSYRRQDTAAYAGRLYDTLVYRFGPRRIFMDVDTIDLGVRWRDEIIHAISGCRVLLTLIGRQWSAATDKKGRRLDDPNDLVRTEIEIALERKLLIIPILCDGASLPSAADLPGPLAELVERQALRVDHESFGRDVGRLLQRLDPIIGVPRAGDTVPNPITAGSPSAHMRTGMYTAQLVGKERRSRIYKVHLAEDEHIVFYKEGHNAFEILIDGEAADVEVLFRSFGWFRQMVEYAFKLQDGSESVPASLRVRYASDTMKVLAVRLEAAGQRLFLEGRV